MSLTRLSRIQPYQPTTFLERGVAMPFTTPLLGGARARPGEKGPLELVVPSLSGEPGVYIFSWRSITTICRPTLHDKAFYERVAALRSMTPGTIRLLARQIAADGFAGEAAMEAALATAQNDKKDKAITGYQLLTTLVGQYAKVHGKNPDSPDLEVRSHLPIIWISEHLSQSATWAAIAMEELADLIGNIGAGPSVTTARLPLLLSQLRQTTKEIGEWSKTQHVGQQEYAGMVGSVAELTLIMAEITLEKAHSLTHDMVDLLRRWAADPVSVARLVGRPEWLLDGWEQICLIWSNARDDASRRAAVMEIVPLLPFLPKEAHEWCGTTADPGNMIRPGRYVRQNEDWRTGITTPHLVARNERFRAAMR